MSSVELMTTRLRLRDFEFGDYKGVGTLLYPVSYWGCAE
jgi:hypothetical protein